MQKTFVATFRQALFNSWWVIAFSLLSLAVYEQGIKERNLQTLTLTKQLIALNNETKLAREKQMRLSREVSSQSDPQWIELVLRKELGLTPEGQKKVIWILP